MLKSEKLLEENQSQLIEEMPEVYSDLRSCATKKIKPSRKKEQQHNRVDFTAISDTHDLKTPLSD